MQRHRLPLRAAGRSRRCAWFRLAAVMIIPAVQKPHWNPCASRKARCIGCNSVAPARAFDGGDGAPPCPEGRGDAAMDRLAVDPDRAGPAISRVAPFLDAEPAELAQEGSQALAGARRVVGRRSVDDETHGARSSSRISAARCAVTRRRQSRRPCTSSNTRCSGIASTAEARASRSGSASNVSTTGRTVEAVTVRRKPPSVPRVPMSSAPERPSGVRETCRKALRLARAVAGSRMERKSSPGAGRCVPRR